MKALEISLSPHLSGSSSHKLKTLHKCLNTICKFKPSSHCLMNYCGSRKYSNSNTYDGNSNNDITSADLRVLPRRVLKRLEKQGISAEDYFKSLQQQFGSKESYKNAKKQQNGGEQIKTDELDVLLKAAKVVPNPENDTEMFPSDILKYKQWLKDEKSLAKVDPGKTSVILFPGQGSQFVGMGKKLLHLPGVKDLYEEASSLLGYNLLDICLNGPRQKLSKTVHCQPAVMITSLAAVERLREEHPQAIENCVATAGFSVGEYAALVFSGVLSFPDAIRVVQIRANAMQEASERVHSGLLSVFLSHDSELKSAISLAKEYCEKRHGIKDPVCKVANYLFPECKVLGGHKEALEFIETNRREFNILRTKRLEVSGAFHTRLMDTAYKPVEKALENLQFNKPKIATYSNWTGKAYHHKSKFPYMLASQVVNEVKWEQIMHDIYTRPAGVEYPSTYELGPGRTCGTLLKQVNMQGFKKFTAIEV